MWPVRLLPYSRTPLTLAPRILNQVPVRAALGVRWQSSSPSSILDTPIRPAKIINEVPDLHFSITNRASKRLAEIYKASKEILRVTVESGGCHGFPYNLKLVPESDKKIGNQEQETDDLNDEDDFETVKDIVYVLPDSIGEVVIDEQSLKILNDTTLTYSTELIGSTFKITGGSMTSSCGCGSSFGLDQET